MSRASSPNSIIPNVWDSNGDIFDHTQLAANWDAVDAAIAAPKSTTRIVNSTTLPVGLNGTTDRGYVVYLTAATGGFQSGETVVWNGTSWQPLNFESLSSVPVSGNFAGRIVLLTVANGGFSQWSLIRYDGSAWATINASIEIRATVPSSGNFAGRLVLLTAADSGFDSYSLISYNGSAWQRTEKRGIEVVSSLPLAPYAGQVISLSNNVGIFKAWDVLRWDGSIWLKLNTGVRQSLLLHLSTPFSITVTDTAIQWDTEDYDPQNIHSSSDTRLQPTEAGVYQVNAWIGYPNTTDTRDVIRTRLYKNGVSSGTVIAEDQRLGGGTTTNVSMMAYMNGTSDFFEVAAAHPVVGNVGNPMNIDANRSYVSMVKVSD